MQRIAVYARLLEASGRTLLLDKTPAYALVLDFVAKLYPKATLPGADAPPARGLALLRRVVLRRRPRRRALATIRCSSATSRRSRASCASGRCRCCTSATRTLVQRTRRPRCDASVRFLGIDFVAAHGRVRQRRRSARRRSPRARRSDHGRPGDAARPRSRSRSGRPDWRTTRPASRRRAQILDRLLDEDLETWGYPRAGIARAARRRDAVAARSEARPGTATRSSAACWCGCARTSTTTPSDGWCSASASSATCCCAEAVPGTARTRRNDPWSRDPSPERRRCLEGSDRPISPTRANCVPCKGGVPPLRGAALLVLQHQLGPDGNGWRIEREHHLEKEFRFAGLRGARSPS